MVPVCLLKFCVILENTTIPQFYLDINGPLATIHSSNEDFLKMWKPVYIICIISLSVPGGSGTMDIEFCSGGVHLSLKLLCGMVFLSIG